MRIFNATCCYLKSAGKILRIVCRDDSSCSLKKQSLHFDILPEILVFPLRLITKIHVFGVVMLNFHYTSLKRLVALSLTTAIFSLPALATPLLNGVSITSYMAGDANERVRSKLEKYYGQEITARLLQQILDEVDRSFHEIGYTATKAYFPEQISSDGTVAVSVASTYLEGTSIDNRSGVNIQTRKMLFADFDDYEGYAINADTINGKLAALADLGIFEVDAEFEHGAYDNAAILDVRLDKRQPYPFQIFTNNHGTKAAGIWRFGAAGQVKNLTHHADILSLAAARSSENQNDGAVSYAIPITSHPTVIGGGLNFGSYELGDQYAILGAKGYAVAGELFLEEPWYRSSHSGLKSHFNVRYKSMKDKFETFGLEFKKSSTAFSGDVQGWYHHDDWWLDGSAEVTYGSVKNHDDYAISPEGSFQIYTLTGAISYRLSDLFTLKGRTEMQLSSKNLESSLRFQAGGASRVSAFKSSEVCGDHGLLVQGALEFTPNAYVTLAPHLEMARVSNHGGDSLTVKGMGLKGSLTYAGFFVSMDISKSLGSVKSEDPTQFLISFGYGRT